MPSARPKLDKTKCTVAGCDNPRWREYTKCEEHQREYWAIKRREHRPVSSQPSHRRADSDETFHLMMFHGEPVNKLAEQLREKLNAGPVMVPLDNMSTVYKLVTETLANDIKKGAVQHVDWPLLGAQYRDLRVAATERIHIYFDENTIQAIVTIGEYLVQLPGIEPFARTSYLPQVKIHHGPQFEKEWWNKRLILSVSLLYTIEKL